MLNIRLICIGKLKENFWVSACDEYCKRLKAFCKLDIIELPEQRLCENPSPAQIQATLNAEAKQIFSKVPAGSYLITLCIEGEPLKSEQLAQRLEKIGVDGFGSLDLIIGSSYGLAQEVKDASHLKLSMSAMTFPHQLARVMLLEQLYRGFMINANGKYHK